MRINKTFIPDQSGPGSTMAVTSNWAPRVTDGHATWKHTCKMQRWGMLEEKEREGGEKKGYEDQTKGDDVVKLKVRSLNVGTMTGKSREIVDLMECRNMDVLYV